MMQHTKPLPSPELVALDASAWLTPEQAGIYLGLSAQTLNQRRHTGTGPHYSKIGRLIRYRKGELDGWLTGGPEHAV